MAIMYWLPIEDLIRTRQKEYYDALSKADRDGNSSEFVLLMLQIIHDTLMNYEDLTDQETDQVGLDDSNVERLLKVIGNKALSAAEIMDALGLRHKPTFRSNYLNPALE